MSHDILEERALAGEKLGCFIVDAHAHIGIGANFPLYADGSAGCILQSMDRYGCSVSCVSAYASLSNYADYGLADLIQVNKDYPGRFFGYFSIDPGYPEKALTQLENGYKAGFRGIKIHTDASGISYADPCYDAVYEFAEKYSLPILAHTWGTWCGELKDLESKFDRYPHVRFILGHAGSAQKEEYARLAKQYSNAYIESCLSYSPKGMIEYFVDQGLADKYLWGSDSNFYAQEHQIGRVIFAEIPLEAKYKILGKNAARVILKGTSFEKQIPAGVLD